MLIYAIIKTKPKNMYNSYINRSFIGAFYTHIDNIFDPDFLTEKGFGMPKMGCLYMPTPLKIAISIRYFSSES